MFFNYLLNYIELSAFRHAEFDFKISTKKGHYFILHQLRNNNNTCYSKLLIVSKLEKVSKNILNIRSLCNFANLYEFLCQREFQTFNQKVYVSYKVQSYEFGVSGKRNWNWDT